MKKKRAISIGIGSDREAADDAIRAWKRAEKGLSPKEPINHLYFEDMVTLFKYLSPKRYELLLELRAIGPINVRKLAFKLKRDYKNVYTDVADLKHIGLIEETKDKRLSVPWDEILSKMPLISKAI